MRKLQSLVRKKSFNKYGYSYGGLQDLQGSFGHDADANGGLLLSIYNTIPEYLDATWAAKWKTKFADVNYSLCWGNCNYDYDEAMDTLKAMAAFFANAYTEVPNVIKPWNAYMNSLGQTSYQIYVNDLGVGKVGIDPTSTSPNGASDNASNGNTENNLPSNGNSNGNSSDEKKSDMLPYYVGGGVIGLGILLFFITRMKK